ncbi:MAG: DtxR family transcriptional regulator [Oscillospiraceae bacterium]|jgi:Mn-dependent DtxR family transcriptional regulator|nr:DtxR family transcriptional regulator [Oscillospiraceae bacterium]
MNIHESGENYLETILLLKSKNGSVRSIDIANKMEFTKASISRAMGILKNADYITVEKNGNIELTEKGEEKAKQIYERHQMITEFFERCLGVNKDIADKDACRIEHVISEESFNGIKKYLSQD